MKSSEKRKAIQDDFIFTISDNESGFPIEEEDQEGASQIPPPKKRVKTGESGEETKRRKQNNDKGRNKKTSNNVGEKGADEDGVWGKNDEDDDAMASDFEFVTNDTDRAGEFNPDEFEGWGFEGARKALGDRKVVDIDEIIWRREKQKKAAKAKATGEAGGDMIEGVASDADKDGDGDEDGINLDDDDDGVLADDAFGMGESNNAEGSDGEDVSDIESEEDREKGVGEDEAAASDNDSVVSYVVHPDDMGNSDESDEMEEAEEEAKRETFFAAEEAEESGKKTDVMSFQGMSLSRPILRGLASLGYAKPTPIQAKTIPMALMGKDVVGGALTGSGKTAAFVVPILERLLYRPKKVPTSRVVILTPTRELAIQCHSVATKLAGHTDIRLCLAVGGLSLKSQEVELRLRPDIIIGTPGRFIDHMRNSAGFSFDTVEILVLDEADRMLEVGFADELNEILAMLPKSRQTMLFSATMTSSVDNLIRLRLNKPVRLMIDSRKKTVTTLTQEFVRLRPGREEKRMGYLVHICKTLYTERAIIFFRQKKLAHKARIVFGLMGLLCAELHGSMNQTQRMNSVEAFRDGKVSFLLATDLASRGLDIKGVDTVINYEAPQTSDIYVHRVGRTARAGRSGVAVTLAAEPDRKVIKAAVRAAKAQGAKIMSRVIDGAEADKWQAEVDEMEDEIEAIMAEEKEEKQLAQVEMQIKKGENMIQHEDEIRSRPRRTWFETQKAKFMAKQAGSLELNGMREKLKKKGAGRLSNKDKKRLDAKAERKKGTEYKKGKAERDGKGVLFEAKQKAKAKAKAKRQGPKGKR